MSRVVLVATGIAADGTPFGGPGGPLSRGPVTATGEREVLSLAVGDSEDKAFRSVNQRRIEGQDEALAQFLEDMGRLAYATPSGWGPRHVS